MKISDLIESLQRLQLTHGDLQVRVDYPGYPLNDPAFENVTGATFEEFGLDCGPCVFLEHTGWDANGNKQSH